MQLSPTDGIPIAFPMLSFLPELRSEAQQGMDTTQWDLEQELQPAGVPYETCSYFYTTVHQNHKQDCWLGTVVCFLSHQHCREGFLPAPHLPQAAVPCTMLLPHAGGGTQLCLLAIRKHRSRPTAKVPWGQLFCRPGVGSEMANCSSVLASLEGQRLKDTGLSTRREV